jgi:hypothetical protein
MTLVKYSLFLLLATRGFGCPTSRFLNFKSTHNVRCAPPTPAASLLTIRRENPRKILVGEKIYEIVTACRSRRHFKSRAGESTVAKYFARFVEPPKKKQGYHEYIWKCALLDRYRRIIKKISSQKVLLDSSETCQTETSCILLVQCLHLSLISTA